MSFCSYLYGCRIKGEMLSNCYHCDRLHSCSNLLGLHSRKTKTVNCFINTFNNGSVEILLYKENITVLEKECNRPKIDRSRKLIYNNSNDCYVVKDDTVKFDNIINSYKYGSKRALDNFYGYGLANDWEYFITLTFNKKYVNRLDDEAVKKCWSNWLDMVRRSSPNVKVLISPEAHEAGGLHFHGFMSNCNITLIPAIYPLNYKNKKLRGKPILSKCGDSIFNIKEWKYGYSTVAVLPKDTNRFKVLNYCMKYIKKNDSVGYNKKRYYRTRNLAFKDKESVLLDYADFATYKDTFIKSCFELVKDTDKFIVLRII